MSLLKDVPGLMLIEYIVVFKDDATSDQISQFASDVGRNGKYYKYHYLVYVATKEFIGGEVFHIYSGVMNVRGSNFHCYMYVNIDFMDLRRASLPPSRRISLPRYRHLISSNTSV